MRIIPPQLFEKHGAQMYNDSTMKFISIGEFWYAIDHLGLVTSSELKSLGMAWLEITQELLDSFPPPRQPVDFVTEELLLAQPVIMFESTVDKGRYFRWDGRHRIIGAHKLGFESLPAYWVPKSLWAQFIIGRETPKAKYAHSPYKWQRTEEEKDTEFGFHDEPNFEKPSGAKDVEFAKVELISSNGRQSPTNAYGQIYKPGCIRGITLLRKKLGAEDDIYPRPVPF